MLRGLVFLALVGGAGFSAWNSYQGSSESPLDWATGEVHAMVTQPGAEDSSLLDWVASKIPNRAMQREEGEPAASEPEIVEAQPAVLRTEAALPDERFTISTETLAAITCGPWDVSEAGIEAILREMVSRGWTPPSGAEAIAASRDTGGAIQAVDPDAGTAAVILQQ